MHRQGHSDVVYPLTGVVASAPACHKKAPPDGTRLRFSVPGSNATANVEVETIFSGSSSTLFGILAGARRIRPRING